MIWFVIIGVVILVVGSIVIKTGKDNEDLAGISLDSKFNVIVNMLNQAAFEGEGQIKYFDKKHFNLYPSISSNQIIEFLYSQGMLSITWKYKYFQKELVYRENLLNVRNLSLFEQENIGRMIIKKMGYKIQQHIDSVMSDTQ